MGPGRRVGGVLGLAALVAGLVLAPRALRRWVEGPATLPTDEVWPGWEDAGSAGPTVVGWK